MSVVPTRAQELSTLLGQRFTEIRIPTPYSGATEIAAGADGFVWFTESRANKIGRVSQNGEIREFEVPTKTSQPVGITLGPDGNMWFTEFASAAIGRITERGKITEFPLLYYDEPLSIASGTGPGGPGLWFITDGGIAFISTDGEVSDGPILPDALDFCGNDILAAASGDQAVFLLGTNVSTLWRLNADATVDRISAITVTRNGLGAMIHCDSYSVSAVGHSTPTSFRPIKDTPTPGTRPLQPSPPPPDFFTIWGDKVPPTIAFGYDGCVYKSAAPGWVQRLRTSGNGDSVRIPSGGVASQVGPGRGWSVSAVFSEYDANRIGAIYLDGSVREGILEPSSGPYGITEDHWGDIWFVEQGSNKIGWVTHVRPGFSD